MLSLLLVAVVASAGYLRIRRALQGEAQQRTKAEATANLATEALDRVFERLHPSRIAVLPNACEDGPRGEAIEVPHTPIPGKESAALLEEMLPFYDRLAQQTANGADLKARTAEANRRVGDIRFIHVLVLIGVFYNRFGLELNLEA